MLDRLLAALVVVPFGLGAAVAPVGRGDVVCHFEDSDIVEASALVSFGGLIYTTNDSGDRGRVFAVDPATGETVGVTDWEDEPTDVEALAPGGRDTVWVGDIGDNLARRDTIQVARVPVGRGDRTAHPQVYDLRYPDGAHDAETLVRDPATGRLYVASKDVLGGHLYAAPAHLRADAPNQLTRLGSVLPIATDGAFFPDGQHLIVRNYQVAVVYAFPSLERVATLPLPAQPQGEGIGVDPDGRVLVSSEGRRSAVLSVTLPASVRDVVEPSSPEPSSPATSDSPTPSDSATGSTTPTPAPGATPTTTREPVWPWGVAGLVALGLIGVVIRSTRRR